jgi:hypothetical protein
MKVQAVRGQKWIQEVQQTQFLLIQESGVSLMAVTKAFPPLVIDFVNLQQQQK